VAVGFERAEQLQELREMRCDFVQGFHVAEPLDADGVAEMLAREAGTGPLDLSPRTWRAAERRIPSGETATLPRIA
jgi:hypothetical protein